MKNIKSYSELVRLTSFEERFQYLLLNGSVGEDTFGSHRYLNQALYNSPKWKRCRRSIIIRDNGCDLGVDGFEINGLVVVHHINPITVDDILNENFAVFDQDNLICVSNLTHKAIHYSNESLLPSSLVERQPFDTCPWRRN